MPESEVGAEEKLAPTIPNNSEKNSFQELFGDCEAAPQGLIEPFENVRHSGRLRKYEEVGIYGDLPVREVIQFRAKYGRHIEGVSQEMQDEYDYWYFTPPSKRKDKQNYAKHVRAWNRRTKWLSEIGGIDYPSITDLSEERVRRRR